MSVRKTETVARGAPIAAGAELEASAPGGPGREPPREGLGPRTPAAGDGHPVSPHPKKIRTVALYLRVSTDDQTVENQERELRAIASRAGWEISAVFKDEGISGSKGRDKRPGLDAALNAAVRREFGMLMAWSVDRLGRSLQDLVATLNELHAVGCDLFLLRQNIDTTTPSGRAMFQMMGVFAEFEREMIRDRVKSGMARAKAQGKRLGKPAVPEHKIAAIKAELARGTGMLKTARLCGVGTFTVQRIKRERMQ